MPANPLALFASTGRKAVYQHWQAWESHLRDPAQISNVLADARKAESVGLDAIFQADFAGLHRADVQRGPVPPFDNMQLAAVIASQVPRITVLPTLSVLFNAPYAVARQLVSLDHIAQGRLAWNMVTSFNGERNYGFEELPSPAARYEQAAEFLEIIQKLWRSWPVDANRPDPESGRFANDNMIQDIHYRGRHLFVEGAIDVPPRTPDMPLLIQAGASPEGIDSGIRQANAMFVAAPTLDDGRLLVERIRIRAAELGRDPSTLRFIFAVRATIGATRDDAERTFGRPLAPSEVDIARKQVEREIEGMDLSLVDLDTPIATDLFQGPAVEAALQRRRSRIETFLRYAAMPDQTLRGMLTRIARRGSHAYVVGTAEDFADELTAWHEAGVADGFILGGDVDLNMFGEDVMPLLRRRGVVDHVDPDRRLHQTLGIAKTPPVLDALAPA